MPLRSEQSGGDAMYLFCFLGRVHVYVCVRFLCVCTFMCVRTRYHQLLLSQDASPCMSYVSCAPSAIHHMPRRRVVVRVGARP